MITKISELREVKEGFNQAFYIENDYEILLSEISAHVALEQHSHHFSQFGYCLQGGFRFLTDIGENIINENNYYILNGEIRHGAISEQNFYALDYKFIGNCNFLTSHINHNEVKNGRVETIYLPNTNIYRCMPADNFFSIKFYNQRLSRYLVSKSSDVKLCGDKNIEIQRMTIYDIKGYKTLDICGGDVLIIEIEKE